MNKELLEKYFNNCCTDEELESVLAWFRESARTAEGKSLLLEVWEGIPNEGSDNKICFDQLLGRIHHQINLSQSKNLLEEADENLIRYKRKERFIRIFIRAAAILLFPVLGYGLYMTSRYQSTKEGQVIIDQSYNEVFSSVDAITKVTLPDGSNVWLNHSSSLRYPAIFRGDNRAVELKGEGYFEIAHNPSKPFIVTAGTLDIMAIGTTFNVMAYPEEDKIETSLIEGFVELNKAWSFSRKTPLVKMKPTDMAVYQKSNDKFTIRTIVDDRYFSWKDGKLIFNKEPIGEVASKLSRWFNVDIQIKDPKLNELTYTGTFVDETLPQVMELMAMISPVSYTISDRKEITPGTFSKRKVVIAYKQN
jgi:ferric-dicitrate binding protein FerR (iron transport regulator)